MMGRRLPVKDGDEQDVTANRAIYVWTKRPGATAKTKRRIRRRERRAGRREAQAEIRGKLLKLAEDMESSPYELADCYGWQVRELAEKLPE